MTITLNIGADVTKAISNTTTVGALTIKPLAPNNGTAINLTIDPVGTKVYSLSQQDGVTENVYNASGSLALPISISAQVCGGASPSPTVTSSVTPSATAVPTAAATPTPTTVVATNQPPVCLTLGTSTSSGSAPQIGRAHV